MLSQSHQKLEPARLIHRILLTSAIAIVGITFAELNSQVVEAQSQAYPSIPSVNTLQARPGDANLLSPAPGLPVTPTIPIPLLNSDESDTFSNETSLEYINSSEPVTPVIPAIPNASPDNPSRNVPVTFTTDPVYAVPLFRD